MTYFLVYILLVSILPTLIGVILGTIFLFVNPPRRQEGVILQNGDKCGKTKWIKRVAYVLIGLLFLVAPGYIGIIVRIILGVIFILIFPPRILKVVEFDNKQRIKRLAYVLIGLLVFALSFTIYIFSNPLRRPADVIRNDILRLTPIGTDMEDVLEIVNEKVQTDGWHIMDISHATGYFDPMRPPTADGFIVGVQRIKAHMGRSRNGWIAVDISWGFDEDSRLIDIYIRKHYTFLT